MSILKLIFEFFAPLRFVCLLLLQCIYYHYEFVLTALSSFRPRGWDSSVTIFFRFLYSSIFYCYLWNLCWWPQFSFHAASKYITSFPGHISFLIWRKTPSSLSESQETLGTRLLNTNKFIVDMLMVPQNEEWFCCKFRIRCHILLPRFLNGNTSQHPINTLWFDLDFFEISMVKYALTRICFFRLRLRVSRRL